MQIHGISPLFAIGFIYLKITAILTAIFEKIQSLLAATITRSWRDCSQCVTGSTYNINTAKYRLPTWAPDSLKSYASDPKAPHTFLSITSECLNIKQ